MTDEPITLDSLATAFADEPVEPAATNAAAEQNSDLVQPSEQDTAEVTEQPAKDSEATEEAEPKGEAEEVTDVEDDQPVFEVKLPDGQTAKVPLKELQDGYTRQADYTRKTAEIAETRKAFEAEAENYRNQTISNLQALNQRYEQLNPVALLQQQRQNALELDDFAEVIRLDDAIKNTEKMVENSRLALNWELEQKEKLAQEAKNTFIAEQREALKQKMPFLSDEKRAQDFSKSLNFALKEVGYTEQELASIDAPDHKQAMLAYYAGKYLEGLKSKPAVVEAMKGKFVSPTPTSRKPASSSNTNEALEILNKNPNSLTGLAGLFA